MPSKEDLKTHALSTTDFYALLSLSPTFTAEKELQRAWRRTALIHHPDKAGADNAAAAEAFHQASLAFEILKDAELRAIYDGARAAREQRAKRDAVLEGDRRKMKEALEGRERRFAAAGAGAGAKRKLGDEETGPEAEEERREREVRRLAEDGRRRRVEMEERMRREREVERERAEEASRKPTTAKPAKPLRSSNSARNGGSAAPSPGDGAETEGQTAGSKGKSLFEQTMERLKQAQARKMEAQRSQAGREGKVDAGAG